MWGSRVSGNTTVSPKADLSSSTPSGKWKSYQNWPLLATNIALIKFGLIGSAVFKDEFMYSQQGTNAAGAATSDYTKFGTDAFIPNLMLDFLTGEMRVNSGIFKGSNATPFGPGVISSQDRVLDFSTGFNFQYEGGGDIFLPVDEKYDGVECSLFSRFNQTSFNVKIVGNALFIDKDHIMNSFGCYSKITVSGKMLRLKAIKHTQKVYWYILNVADFNQSELIH